MEGSRVSDLLTFCVEKETKPEGKQWSSTTCGGTLEGASETEKKIEASDAAVWGTCRTASGNRRHSGAGESENNVAAGIAEEKCCRLEVEEAYATNFSSEMCETPRSSECNTGATAGDSTVPSCSDVEAEADTFTDHELPAGITGGKYCRLEVEETYSPAFSSETSECQTGATAGDSTVPSCSDTEADVDAVADNEVPVDTIETGCSRLEVEQAMSRSVFNETCESLSRSTECNTDAAAAGDSTVPSLSDADESEHFEGVSAFHTPGESPRQTLESCEGWATDLSTMSSEMEEGMWKEVRHGKRRPLQGSKPGTKRLPRVALVALFDAVDAFITEAGAAPPGPPNGARGLGRGAGSFSASRRSTGGSRAPGPPEPEEAPSAAEAWASKRLQATVEAIASRLENVERCVLSYHSNGPDTSQEAMDEQRLLLLEVEKKMAGVMSLRIGDQKPRRTFLQAKVELLIRRLLRLRDVLQAGGGGGGGSFTELDVQMALKGARKHLRTAQGAAARLSHLLLAAGGEA